MKKNFCHWSSYTLGMKDSHYQEEPTVPDLNRKNENLQLFCLLLHLGLDRGCE